MSPPDSEPTRWAILIGVGMTISRKGKDSKALISDRPLQGAVNDIRSLEKYLESRPFAVDITRLTATKPKDSPLKSAENVDQLPTHDNVVSALKKILKTSRPNDHVCIYYSGHGCCRAIDGAVALELVNPLTLETEYFSFDNPFDDTGPEELRDGVVTLSRLLDPQCCTIITACGPHEVASELNFEDGATSGALSYFLINSLVLLSRCGTKVSNEMLYQHLRAQFHSRLPDQTPMLYGHRGFAFFGDFSDEARHASVSTASTYRSMEDGCLILHAGQAHGVHKNDEYTLTPFDRSTNPKGKVQSGVECTKSRLPIIQDGDSRPEKRSCHRNTSSISNYLP
ncbi:caspase domain-containing protein [Fusarium mexicanum]|uniref:Caspase domain-containing protein n=1 Tax=Fusarium mexicanum TaxID=751941 RepID=A0A8H5IGY2_9HYPO|nr:caspase domain-containing protein [Fusarium mexicanum]